eukprot:Rhum_TRINITY_DN15306_c4_g1::Rhum_TRINITY_DN15306_c4_g1_i1::g.150221::m.150221
MMKKTNFEEAKRLEGAPSVTHRRGGTQDALFTIPQTKYDSVSCCGEQLRRRRQGSRSCTDDTCCMITRSSGSVRAQRRVMHHASDTPPCPPSAIVPKTSSFRRRTSSATASLSANVDVSSSSSSLLLPSATPTRSLLLVAATPRSAASTCSATLSNTAGLGSRTSLCGTSHAAHGCTPRHPPSRLSQRKRLQRVVVDGRRVRPHQQPVDVERLLVCEDVVDDRLWTRLAQPHLRHLLHTPLRPDQRPGRQRTRLLPVPRRHRPRDVREQQHLAVCAGHRVVVRDVRRTAVQPHQPPRPKLRHVHEQHPRRLPGRTGQQIPHLHVAHRLPPAARQSSPRVAGEAAAAGVQPLLESI